MIILKKLPKIYQNDINKKISNNKVMCYVEEVEDININKEKVEDTLSHVFAGLGHVYNTRVIIETKDKTYDTSLISKNKKELITIDNDVIKIDDIKKIKIVK